MLHIATLMERNIEEAELHRPVNVIEEFARTIARELDYVIEIVLDREIAKERIMGRRLCVNDNNHPNHIAFEAIKPVEKDGKIVCRVCGGDLNTRADDQDEDAIAKRHNIYYDETTGTMAAVIYFKQAGGPKGISVDGSKSIRKYRPGGHSQGYLAPAEKAVLREKIAEVPPGPEWCRVSRTPLTADDEFFDRGAGNNKDKLSENQSNERADNQM